MKTITFGLVMCATVLCACDTKVDNIQQPAIQAGIASISHAKADEVDFRVFSIASILQHRNGEMAYVEKSMTSPFIEEIRTSLRGKRYWEVCYGVTEEGVLGAIYCYCLDYESLKLLTTYRMK